LDQSLRRRNSRLILRRGPLIPALLDLCRVTGARRIVFGRRYEPAARHQEVQLLRRAGAAGIECQGHNTALLFEPWEVRTRAGGPFRVFTPFYRSCLERAGDLVPAPAPPSTLPGPGRWPRAIPLSALGLLPRHDWAAGILAAWKPGEEAARRKLKRFLADPILRYQIERDRPDHAGTSRLSPHLHFGEVGPRSLWQAARQRAASARQDGILREVEGWLRQLIWREFAYHLLYHFPETTDQPLNPTFRRFPWARSGRNLKAWRRGRTGYPLVDAGMRELWTTGWMHNRVRMVAASFLVKDLLLPWREGARWFYDTLVDADLANNTLGWQWCAGCGADAAPYFRVFNPVSQSEKFDPEGAYIRRWVPELASLPEDSIHRPWEVRPTLFPAPGGDAGPSYPDPLVEHAEARKRALAAYASLRGPG